jgi:hypothetical protein
VKRLRTSIVAWSGAAAMASFGILYQVMPYQSMLDLSLSLATGAALATVVRYFVDFLRSVRDGRTGANFLISAVFSIALVVLVQRVWVQVLSIYGRPEWLTDSSMSIFIPWMLAWAVSMAFIAPDVDDYNVGERRGVWKSVALFLGGAIAGFVLASSFRLSAEDVSAVSLVQKVSGRPSCAVGEDVWVSSRGVYHTVSSPYRAMVIPDWCFATEAEAEAKGFRPPAGAVD